MGTEKFEPEQKKADNGMLDTLRLRSQGLVNESRLPSVDYISTVGIYGGKLMVDADGRLAYNTRGLVSQLDHIGDAMVRTFDEHTVRDLGAMLRRRPKAFVRFLWPGTKRYRGNNAEILENAERLGLGEYYGAHPDGIEIKKPELYTKGRALQDIYRADVIGDEKLKTIDRFQALEAASQYVRDIHDAHGGIGELLVGDIIFQEQDGDAVKRPVLNLPDIVYNAEKVIGIKEKKATDLLDFLASVATEELRRSTGDPASVARALDSILGGYDDRAVITLVKSYVGRGRLTLQGDREMLDLAPNLMTTLRPLASQHNIARLAVPKDVEAIVKRALVDACARYSAEQ